MTWVPNRRLCLFVCRLVCVRGCLFAWLFVCLFVCHITHCFSDFRQSATNMMIANKQKNKTKCTKLVRAIERGCQYLLNTCPPCPHKKGPTKNDAMHHFHRCCCCLVMQTSCWGASCFVVVVWGSLLQVMFMFHFCCGLAAVEDPKSLDFISRRSGESFCFWDTPKVEVLEQKFLKPLILWCWFWKALVLMLKVSENQLICRIMNAKMRTRSPDWLIGGPLYWGKDDIRSDPFAKHQNIF